MRSISSLIAKFCWAGVTHLEVWRLKLSSEVLAVTEFDDFWRLLMSRETILKSKFSRRMVGVKTSAAFFGSEEETERNSIELSDFPRTI